MYYTVDRTRAQQLGLNMQDVANNLNISLSSSEQVSPNFWTDPKNGIPYFMAVQTPEYRIADKNQLDNTPLASGVDASGTPIPTVLGNIATAQRGSASNRSINHSNIQPVYDVYGSVAGSGSRRRRRRDLRKIVAEVEPQAEARQSHRHSRPDRQHEVGLRQSGAWAHLRRGVRLYADGHQLSELP